jgi:hypothetical protein
MRAICACNGIKNAGTRDRERRAIDALGQVGRGFQAAPPVDLAAGRAHQMDIAPEGEAFEIGEQARPERAGRGRCADDGNGPRPQHTFDGTPLI